MARSTFSPATSRIISARRGEAFADVLVDEDDWSYLSQFSWSIGSHGYAQRFVARVEAEKQSNPVTHSCPGGCNHDAGGAE